MLKSALIVVAVSIAAGATIRAWAFAIFAFFLMAAFGVVILLKGSSLTEAIVSSLKLLVLMEICYLAGLFAFSLWGAQSKAPEKERHCRPLACDRQTSPRIRPSRLYDKRPGLTGHVFQESSLGSKACWEIRAERVFPRITKSQASVQLERYSISRESLF